MLNIVQSVSDFIWSAWILMPLLITTALYFSFRTKFVQFRLLKKSISFMTQKTDEDKQDKAISPLEAFLIGLASRIGTGNITGVALAIMTGGPGAIFWMWVVALIVAASSFVESTLAQIYKEKETEKGYVGGPSYYMKKGLNAPKMGVVFALLLMFSYGLVFVAIQSNTIVASLQGVFYNVGNTNLFPIVIGLILAILVGYVLFGGASRIASFSSFIVPLMAVGYLLLALLVTALNFEALPGVISAIFAQAFTPDAMFGATIGGVIIVGAKRGMFSNEAGMGSAPNAAATATTNHPVNQGLIQSLGVFVDTILVCTATGLIILTSLSATEMANFVGQSSNPEFSPIIVTQTAMVNTLGEWSGALLTVFIFFFAFSSIIGNYYYSESSLEYVSRKVIYRNIFKVTVVIIVFFAAIAESALVWTLGDLTMGLMAILNIIAITLLFNKAYLALKDFEKQLKENKEPVFNEKVIPGLKGTVWTDDRKKLESEQVNN